MLRAVLALALAAAVAGVLWFRPDDGMSQAALQRYFEQIRAHPLGAVVVVGIYCVGGFVALPLTLLIVATLIVFGPAYGIPIAFAGSLASAALMFAIGRSLGELTVQRWFGERFALIRRRLERCNVVTMTVVRLVPIAPFTVVNVVAGAAGISFAVFLGGTALGLIPGVTAIALITGGLAADTSAAVISVGAGVVLLLLLVGASRWRRSRPPADRLSAAGANSPSREVGAAPPAGLREYGGPRR